MNTLSEDFFVCLVALVLEQVSRVIEHGSDV